MHSPAPTALPATPSTWRSGPHPLGPGPSPGATPQTPHESSPPPATAPRGSAAPAVATSATALRSRRWGRHGGDGLPAAPAPPAAAAPAPSALGPLQKGPKRNRVVAVPPAAAAPAPPPIGRCGVAPYRENGGANHHQPPVSPLAPNRAAPAPTGSVPPSPGPSAGRYPKATAGICCAPPIASLSALANPPADATPTSPAQSPPAWSALWRRVHRQPHELRAIAAAGSGRPAPEGQR